MPGFPKRKIRAAFDSDYGLFKRGMGIVGVQLSQAKNRCWKPIRPM